jgi:hypothetical protein
MRNILLASALASGPPAIARANDSLGQLPYRRKCRALRMSIQRCAF